MGFKRLFRKRWQIVTEYYNPRTGDFAYENPGSKYWTKWGALSMKRECDLNWVNTSPRPRIYRVERAQYEDRNNF